MKKMIAGLVALLVLLTGSPANASAEPQPGIKGRPGVAAQKSGAKLLTVNFLYNVARQTVSTDGIGANLHISKPYLNPADYHTLTEISAQSANQQQTVEVGWTVDPSLNGGSSDPFLFVGWWLNGVFQGYNSGTGWVDYAPNPINVGANLIGSLGLQKRFIIQYSAGNWWIAYDGAWIGHYPGTLWGGTYTKAGLVQAFGEVAASSATPCTDMGNGINGTAANTTAARLGSLQIYNPVPAGTPASFTGLGQPASVAGEYDITALSVTTFRYGGWGTGSVTGGC